MVSRTKQRTVYLLTAVIVASMIGGFALATMSLGGTSQSYQASQTTTVSPIQGLTWEYTNLSEVPGVAAVTNPCTHLATACDVTTGGTTTICAGSFNASLCNPSDFVEQVNLSVSQVFAFPTPGTVAITVYVSGTPFGGTFSTFVGPTAYFTEGNPATAPSTTTNILLDFDIGVTPTGPGAVSSVSVIVTAS